MRLQEVFDTLSMDSGASRVYGQPYETADGATIITVARVRGKTRPGGPHVDGGAPPELSVRAKPVGVFVIKNGNVSWKPAVDETRIALVAELIGLVAATLATLAMVRRPPWPDLWGSVSRRV
jgi:hypothetical protein